MPDENRPKPADRNLAGENLAGLGDTDRYEGIGRGLPGTAGREPAYVPVLRPTKAEVFR